MSNFKCNYVKSCVIVCNKKPVKICLKLNGLTGYKLKWSLCTEVEWKKVTAHDSNQPTSFWNMTIWALTAAIETGLLFSVGVGGVTVASVYGKTPKEIAQTENDSRTDLACLHYRPRTLWSIERSSELRLC